MKNLRTVFTTVLTAVLLCVTGSVLYAQTVIQKAFPSTTTFSSDLEAPNGLAAQALFRGHIIIPASEIDLPSGTVLRSIGFRFEGGTDVPAGGQIKFYLENTSNAIHVKSTTWSTAITGMNQVYSGAFTLPTGILDEADASVDLTSTFTYTGAGLYIAYDYTGNTFANIPARALMNAVLTNGAKSGYTTALPAPTTVGASLYRPQLLLGYNNPFNNELEVRNIRSNAIAGKALTGANLVTAVIRNNGNSTVSDLQVTMQASGVNTGSFVETIPTIDAGDSAEVVFTAPVNGIGMQHITVSVPADQENSNNSFSYEQQLNCETWQFVSDQYGYDSVGFAGGSGILAIKYPVSQVPVRVDAITFRVSRDPANVGQSVTAVVIDEYNAILTTSAPFVIEASMLGTDQVIPLSAPVSFLAGENFFAGILQEAGNNFPVGTAWPKKIPPGIAYTFDETATISTESTLIGTFMIGIKAVPFLELASSAFGQIMDGTQVMYVGTAGFTHYNFKVNGISKYSGIDNYFIYYPAHGDIITLEATNNNCSYTAPETITMDVSAITPGTGNILYVNRHAATPGDGRSWEEPLTELSDAMRWAKVRQSSFTTANPLKIFVAGGTYKPLYSAVDETFGLDGGPNNAFLLVKNVQLYGGFAGTENSAAERDFTIPHNKTILSGDYSDDDVITGDAQTLSMANMFENALHIVVASGETSNGLIDGFTIVGGGGEMFGMPTELINGNPVSTLSGGAVYIVSSSPQLRNLIIAGNKADQYGGAIYAKNSSAAITNTLVFKNLAGVVGGAIYNDNGATVYYTNLTITNNRSLTGAGVIANNVTSPFIRNSIIFGNNAGIENAASTPQIMYSLVQGMAANATNHNLDGSIDPQFTSVAGDDYSLRSTSGMINRGSNSYFQAGQTPDLTSVTRDLNSKARIQENTIDLGAYEAKPSLEILQHPVDATSCEGSDVNFVVLVNSAGSGPSYQWQQSTDGNNWANIEGAIQHSYLLKTSTEMHFRCIISIPGYSITTHSAKLSTIPFKQPEITIPDRICLNENNIELKASPSGGIFEGDGVSENTWSLLNFKAGKQIITYNYTAPNGCQGSAEKIVFLESCITEGPIKLFSGQPNPTRSIVSVKIMMGREIREAELHVSSIAGQIVMRKRVKLARGANNHDFDLSHLGAGIYFVIIYNESKKPLGSIRIIKQ